MSNKIEPLKWGRLPTPRTDGLQKLESTVSAVGTAASTLVSALNAVAQASMAFASGGIDLRARAIDTAIQAARKVLARLEDAGQISVLFVPPTDEFLSVVRRSCYDQRDPNRPRYRDEDFIGGGVLLSTFYANEDAVRLLGQGDPGTVRYALQKRALLTQEREEAGEAFRAIADFFGVGATPDTTMPAPTNVAITVLSKGVVRITWDDPKLVRHFEQEFKGIDVFIEQKGNESKVKGIIISSGLIDDLKSLVVRVDPSYDNGLPVKFHVNFNYAVGLGSSTSRRSTSLPVLPFLESPAKSSTGNPPNWEGTTLVGAIPALSSAIEMVDTLLVSLQASNRSERDEMQAIIAEYSKMANAISNKLNAIVSAIQKLLTMITSLQGLDIYSSAFSGEGGVSGFLSALESSTQDQNLPPKESPRLDLPNVSAGLVVLAGGPGETATRAEIEKIQDMIRLLLPTDEGARELHDTLRSAIADVGAASTEAIAEVESLLKQDTDDDLATMERVKSC